MNLYSLVHPAMATEFTLFLYAESASAAAETAAPAFAEIDRIEDVLSNYRDGSELTRINSEAYGHEVLTDPETFRFLEAAFAWSVRSHGAFDMTVGRLMKTWGFYEAKGAIPSPAELREASSQVGWEKVRLDHERRTIRFLSPDLELDPGGIGKGYAVDRAIHVLVEGVVRSALLSAGSSTVYALGAPRGQQGWGIEVTDPYSVDHIISELCLRDTSLSTANYSRKYFVQNGRRYGSIMNPRTLRPVDGVRQVSAIAPSALDSDVLSNALFVLEPGERAGLIRRLPQSSALVVLEGEPTLRFQPILWPAAVAAGRKFQVSAKENRL